MDGGVKNKRLRGFANEYEIYESKCLISGKKANLFFGGVVLSSYVSAIRQKKHLQKCFWLIEIFSECLNCFLS